MNGLKNIREKLGVSQQDIAHWLGISRSLATHFEIGSRSLPAAALIKLSKLEIIIYAFEKEHGTVEKTTDEDNFTAKPLNNIDDTTPPMHPRLAFELEKRNQVQRKLLLLKNKYSVLQRQVLLIKHVMDKINEKTSEKEKCWLQMVYDTACYKASKYDDTKQLPLKAKLLEMRVKEEMKNKVMK
jgi:transcriptional regulator with XRE-family HTH domain